MLLASDRTVHTPPLQVISGSRINSQILRVQHTGLPNPSMLAASAPQMACSPEEASEWHAIREGSRLWVRRIRFKNKTK
jgi:hypothetical protein